MKNIIPFLIVIISFASCKKKDTTTPTPAPAPASTYNLTYNDGSAKTYSLPTTIMLGMSSFPLNANVEFGTCIKTGNALQGYINIVTPLDSSNMHKLASNINYNTNYYTCVYGQSISDSYIGCLSFELSGSSGTDSTLNQTQTTTYYNKISSVQYIGRKYDTYNSIMSPQYKVTGVFNAQVKNNVSHQTRVFSNGQYSFIVSCRAQ